MKPILVTISLILAFQVPGYFSYRLGSFPFSTVHYLTILILFATVKFIFVYKTQINKYDYKICSLILLWSMWGLLTILSSGGDHLSSIKLFFVFHGGSLFLAAILILRHSLAPNLLIYSYYFGICLTLYSWYMFLFNLDWSIDAAIILEHRFDSGLLTVPGLDKNTFGVLLVSLFFTGFIIKSETKNPVWYLSQGLLVSSVFPTGSRQALTLLIFLLGVYIWQNSQSSIGTLKKASRFVLSIAAVIGFALYLPNTEVMFNRLGIIDSNIQHLVQYSDQLRLTMIEDSINEFVGSPIWGIGLSELSNSQLTKYNHSDHNFFTALTAGEGLIGFMLFGLMLLALWQRANQIEDAHIKNMSKTFILTMSTASLLAPPIWYLWFVIGLMLNFNYRSNLGQISENRSYTWQYNNPNLV